MQIRKPVNIIIIGCIIIILFFFFYQTDKIVVNSKDEGEIQHLDLIVSNGQSILSKLSSLFNYSVRGYSHIGVIVIKNKQIFVLHSTPDGTIDNGIRLDKLQTFIDLSKINYYKIVRYNFINFDKEKIDKKILTYLSKKTPFDYDFDNYSKDKIYCSELIYDIYNDFQLIKTNFDLSKPIHPKVFTEIPEFKTILERKTLENFKN
jgi:hypothetical protein